MSTYSLAVADMINTGFPYQCSTRPYNTLYMHTEGPKQYDRQWERRQPSPASIGLPPTLRLQTTCLGERVDLPGRFPWACWYSFVSFSSVISFSCAFIGQREFLRFTRATTKEL